MVIKGKSVAGASRLAAHLERTDTNERMEVKEVRGVAAEDLRGALREMEVVALGCPNCKKPFYHASINTPAEERLTDAQRTQSIDRLEKELGLTGQPRVVVVHEKEGREHCHVVWSRIDHEKMRTLSDSHNYRKHELVARELEREFGHGRVQGAHIERDGRPSPDGSRPPRTPRPARTPSHKEHQQAERTGITPKAARAHITKIWQRADSGQAFAKGLEDSGWTLAKGDRRDFVVIDPKGGVHSLARRVEGAKVKDVRARLADIDMTKLPSVAEGRATQLARHPPQPARETSTQAPTRRPTPQPDRGGERVRVIGGVARPGVARAAGGALRGAGKLLGGVASVFESLLGGGPSRPRKSEQGEGGAVIDDNKRPLDGGRIPPQEQIDEARRQDQEQRSARRQRYLADYSQEVPQERERDVEIERDNKNKGRERER